MASSAAQSGMGYTGIAFAMREPQSAGTSHQSVTKVSPTDVKAGLIWQSVSIAGAFDE